MHSKDIAVGYALGYNDGLGQGGGTSSDEWQFPEGWGNIPDPSANQIVMMVEIDDAAVGKPVMVMQLTRTNGYASYTGAENIDWGDGYIDYPSTTGIPNFSHSYVQAGLYYITVNCSDELNCLELTTNITTNTYLNGVLQTTTNVTVYCSTIRLIIFGSNTALYKNIPQPGNAYALNLYNGLVYLRFKGVFKAYYTNRAPTFPNQNHLCKLVCDDLPTSIDSSAFSYCINLQDIDFAKNLTAVPQNAFTDCYTLKTVELPNATEIGNSAFARCYNLKKVNVPLVTNIGSQSFYDCGNLQEITYADGCTIVSGSFKYCYNLYPKP